MRYSRWYKTIPDQDDKFVQDLGQEFRRRQIKVGVGLSTTRWVRNWLNQGLSNMQGFIGLVSLSILVLGGIGVASVTRVFIQHRLRTIAILKCIGGRNRPVIGAYLTQSIGLGLAGSVFGLALAYLVTVVGTRYGASRLPLDIKPGLTWHASIEGVAVGLMITLLFAVPALLDIRNIKPNLLLRRDTVPARLDWVQLISKVVVVAILIGFAMWQAGSYRRAWVFISAIAATALVLNLAGSGVIRLLRQVRRLRSFPLRYGVGGLSRPGNQTKVVLFAVGIGTLFIVTVRIHQANVLAGYSLNMTALEADMFLIDVQPDQRAAVEATVPDAWRPPAQADPTGAGPADRHQPGGRPHDAGNRRGGERADWRPVPGQLRFDTRRPRNGCRRYVVAADTLQRTPRYPSTKTTPVG